MTLHVYSNIGKKAVSLSRNPPTAPAPVAGVNQMHAQRAPCGMPRYAHITHVRKYFIVVRDTCGHAHGFVCFLRATLGAHPARPTEGLGECACECGQLNMMNEQGDPLARTGEVSTHMKPCARMSAAHSLILAATRIHTPTTASRGCFFTRVGGRVRTGGDGTERRDAAVTWCIGAASSSVEFQRPRINPQWNPAAVPWCTWVPVRWICW